MNRLGYPNCFTASIKNRWHHCQYPVQNSLQSNNCKGVHLCLLPDSTAPKLIKNLLLLLVIYTEIITEILPPYPCNPCSLSEFSVKTSFWCKIWSKIIYQGLSRFMS